MFGYHAGSAPELLAGTLRLLPNAALLVQQRQTVVSHTSQGSDALNLNDTFSQTEQITFEFFAVFRVPSSSFQSQLALTRLKFPTQSRHAVQHRCSIDMFGEEVGEHLLCRLLAKRDLAFGDHRLHSKKHCVDVFHSSESLVGFQLRFQLSRPSTRGH